MNKILAIALFFSVIAGPAFATGGKHSVDQTLDTCLEKNGTTIDMRTCYNQAYKSWDAELNKSYKLLIKVLNKDSKKALLTSQLSWLKFRDNELNFLNKMYSQKRGTMYSIMADSDASELVRNRAIILKGYYQVVTDQEQ